MFGKKFEITEAQIKKLNSLLPKELQRTTFDKRNFRDGHLHHYFVVHLKNIKKIKKQGSKKH